MKKHAACFATLQQNELNSDVVHFTTDVQTCLATNKVARFFFLGGGGGGKMCNFAVQLILQQSYKTSCTCFVVHFTN